MSTVEDDCHPDSEEEIEATTPFRIPIFQWDCGDDDLNGRLRQSVLKRYEDIESTEGSNRAGGWQSPYTLHKWDDPGVGQLLHKIESMLHHVVRCTVNEPIPAHFEEWLIEGWGNVNVQGARNESHSHGTPQRPALWSGVYYVQSGRTSEEEDIGGKTVFEDRVGIPREVINNEDPARGMTVDPESGLLVMFPSTLNHRVEPYRGDDVRITIAFNLYHSGFSIPYYSDRTKKESTIYGSRALWHGGQVLRAIRGAVLNPSVLLKKLTGREKGRDGSKREENVANSLLRELRDQEGRQVSKLQS